MANDSLLPEWEVESLKKGDYGEVLWRYKGYDALAIVYAYRWLLVKSGKYEEALLVAYIGTEGNFSGFRKTDLDFLFSKADIEKLRAAGDPIPDKPTFTLYRGVHGRGKARRVSSFSWTESPNTAAWFATRLCFNPEEDHAVYTITVPNESIMACIMDRHEEEYLVKLPLPTKPKRLKELPEVIDPKGNQES